MIMLTKNDIDKLTIKTFEPDFIALGNSDDDDPGVIKGIDITRIGNGPIERLNISRDFEIICVFFGEADVTVSDKRYRVSDGALVVIAPGISYSIHIPDNASAIDITIGKQTFNDELYRVIFYNSSLSSFFSRAMWGDTFQDCMVLNKFINKYLYECIEMLVSEFQFPGEYSGVKMINILMTLIGYMSEGGKNEYVVTGKVIKKYDQLPRILDYIDKNFRTVTLEELAGHFHYTVPYVSKLIKTSTGLTFTEIISKKKFEVCRSLLVTTDLKINKIAALAGYQNTDHFNRSFKKRVGVTPSDYKKTIN